VRKINNIIIHCSDSSFGTAKTINDWHKERGFGAKGIDGKVYNIGYHYVINNGYIYKDMYLQDWDGVVEKGRPDSLAGAHCKGQNSKSIGICLIGVDKFTDKQFESLTRLIKELMLEYDLDDEQINGHYEYSDKSCPNFNVTTFVHENVINNEQAIEG
jgi:N-acetylmuramoyl-L-alanine amidase